MKTFVNNIKSAVIKDKEEDLKTLKNYVKVIAKSEEKSNDELYQEFAKQVAKC